MPVFDPTSVSADHWMYARTLFDNYDVETIQSIFQHLSSMQSAMITHHDSKHILIISRTRINRISPDDF